MDPKLLEEVIKVLPDDALSNRKLICKFIGKEEEIDEDEYKENHTVIILEAIEKITQYASFEQLDQLITELPMHSVYESAVIKYKGLDYADYCLKNRSTVPITASTIISAIKDINNAEFTEKCLLRADELQIGLGAKIDLISSCKNMEYIDKCIGNWLSLDFDKEDIIDIITFAQNNEYIKEWVRKGRLFGFTSDDIVRLVLETKDEEFIETCISKKEQLGIDNDGVVDFIKHRFSIKNSMRRSGQVRENIYEDLKKWIEIGYKNGLEPIDVTRLIFDATITDYIEENMDNAIKECKLDSRSITFILEEALYYKNEELFKYLSDESFREKLDDRDLLLIVLNFKSRDCRYRLKNDFDSLIENLDENTMQISKCLSDDEYLQKYLEKKNDKHKSKITLSPDMTIGIEIENVGRFSNLIKQKQKLHDWDCKGDSTVLSKKIDENGLEVTSPILTGDTEKTTNSIRNMCDLLNSMGQNVNATCGGHIHIGGDYLTSTKSWENLIELYVNCEKILYLIGNEKGEIAREGVINSAEPVSKELELSLDKGEIDLKDENDLEKFKKKLSLTDRYRGINFSNLGRTKIGTIEFRIPNGTINSDTWIENINLFGGIVKVAEDIHKIQEKDASERTEKECEVLKKFEDLKSGELDELEKLKALLDLAIPDENKYIYLERYEVNSKLLHQNPYIEGTITNGTRTKQRGFKLKIDKVGKAVIGGSERIKGDEYEKARTHVRSSLIRDTEYEVMHSIWES